MTGRRQNLRLSGPSHAAREAAAFGRASLPARRALLVAAATLGAGLLAFSWTAGAQDQRAATDTDVIFARKALKDKICDKLMGIERMISSGRIDVDTVDREADAISAMLMAFPHLFPPSSNQWKPGNDQDPASATLASPDLWKDFARFYSQATAASKSALELSRAATAEDVKSRARELRITCDTCHALYLEDQ